MTDASGIRLRQQRTRSRGYAVRLGTKIRYAFGYPKALMSLFFIKSISFAVINGKRQKKYQGFAHEARLLFYGGREMSHTVNLFGFDFFVDFSAHSNARSAQRNVPKLLVFNALEDAGEEIGDNIRDGNDFVVIDEAHDFALVAVMHFKDETIDIKTVLESADCYTRPDDTVIRIKRNGSKEVSLP